MKHAVIILIITSLSIYCHCQNNKVITPYYVIDIHLVKERNKDSISAGVAFKNTDIKSVFILDSFTAKWDIYRRELEITFGEILINSRDSSQSLLEVVPGKTRVFRQIVPNYLNDSSIVRLSGGFVNVQNPGTKDKYVRKDFPRWEDYRNFTYTFLANCY